MLSIPCVLSFSLLVQSWEKDQPLALKSAGRLASEIPQCLHLEGYWKASRFVGLLTQTGAPPTRSPILKQLIHTLLRTACPDTFGGM